MSLLSKVTRVAKTNSKWYLFLGVLSLLKAVGLRHDKRRLRRELMDAGLYLGLGLLLRKVESKKKAKTSSKQAKGKSSKKSSKSSKSSKKQSANGSGIASLKAKLSGEEQEPESKVDQLRRRLSDSGGKQSPDSVRSRFTRS